MSRPYTGKVITRQAEVKQKNGDVYVYERTYQYDREKRRTVTLSNRLIGKKVAGSGEIVPTSHKSSDGSAAAGKLVPLRSSQEAPSQSEEEGAAVSMQSGAAGQREKDAEEDKRILQKNWSLKKISEDISRVHEAFESCFGRQFASRLCLCLWSDISGDADSAEKRSVIKELSTCTEAMETLCLLRSSIVSDAFWIALLATPEAASGGEDPQVRVLLTDSDGETLGFLTLDADLDPIFSLERAFDGVFGPLGCLIVRENGISDSESLRRLTGSSQLFLARSFLEISENAQEHTSFLWRDQLIQCFSTTVSADEHSFRTLLSSAGELTAHKFIRPRELAARLEELYIKAHRVLARLLEGVMPDELSAEARTVQEKFLVHRRENIYELNDDRLYEEADRLTSINLITNARMEPEKAFSWYMAGRDFLRGTADMRTGDAAFGVLRDMLEDAASQLIARAADLGRSERISGGSLIEEEGARIRMAAVARLENESLKELNRIVSQPETPVEERVRRLIIEAFESEENKK